MRLYYYQDPHGNFGDDLNPWLWPRLAPGLLDEDPGTLFVGIGTLLNHWIPAAPRKVVFGSGAGYGPPPRPDETWDVACVRGPHTARQLGLSPSKAVTDSAALIGTLDLGPRPPRSGLGFMPHHRSATQAHWEAYCRLAGVRYIDPRWPVERILDAIRRCDVLAAEAMHGAIVADAVRTPWVPVALYEHILDGKWLDWTASLGLEYKPVRPKRPLRRGGKGLRWAEARLRPPFVLHEAMRAAERAEPSLSRRDDLDAAVVRLQDALQGVQARYGPRDGEPGRAGTGMGTALEPPAMPAGLPVGF